MTHDLRSGSRRELLSLLGLLPFFSVPGCGKWGSESSDGASPVDLRFWGTGTLDIGSANWKLAEQFAKVRIAFEDNGNDLGPVIARMVSGTASHQYDIGGVQGGAEPELFHAGAIVPWALDKISEWSNLWEWVRSIPYLSVDGQQIGIPVVVNADSIIYRQSITGVVDSYSSVFDPKFRGRSSMEDSWMNSVIFAAIYMKEHNIDGMSKIQDPGNLEQDDLHTVIEFLKKHKRDGQFYKFWNGWQDGLDLIVTGRVVVMTGWEPIVYAARDHGVPDAQYASPIEGYEGWSNNLILHAGVRDQANVGKGLEEAAHRFVNWQLSGAYGCILGALRGYMVPNGECVRSLQAGPMEYFDTNKKQNASVIATKANELDEHVRTKFEQRKGRVHWQNARPKNYALYERLWAELRTA